MLLKGASTIVTDGARTAVNIAGTPGQAKGGSGDVLSGLIAGLCAGGLSAFDGGCAGAYLAGKAAEFAAGGNGGIFPHRVGRNFVYKRRLFISPRVVTIRKRATCGKNDCAEGKSFFLLQKVAGKGDSYAEVPE